MADFGNDFKLLVDTGELKAKADTVTGLVSRMRGQLEEIGRIVDKTSDYWIGEGGNARRNNYKKQQQKVEEMMKRLAEYPPDLLQIAGIYETAEGENAQRPAALSANVIV